jgi:hypothetical protein
MLDPTGSNIDILGYGELPERELDSLQKCVRFDRREGVLRILVSVGGAGP